MAPSTLPESLINYVSTTERYRNKSILDKLHSTDELLSEIIITQEKQIEWLKFLATNRGNPNWRYDTKTGVTATTITSGNISKIVDVTQSEGVVHGFYIMVNNKNAALRFIVDDLVIYETLSFMLDTMYMDFQNPFRPRIYKNVAGYYGVSFEPSTPLPFNSSVLIQVENPTTSSIVLRGYSVLLQKSRESGKQ